MSFDPVKSALPLCVIGNAIGEGDRARIEALIMRLGIPQDRLDDASLFGGLDERELDVRHTRTLPRVLHAALTDEGLWRGPLDEFPSVFEMQSFIRGPWMLMTAFSRDVARTGAVHYHVDTRSGFIGERIRHILVLCVALGDERILAPAAKRFKLLAAEAGLPV